MAPYTYSVNHISKHTVMLASPMQVKHTQFIHIKNRPSVFDEVSLNTVISMLAIFVAKLQTTKNKFAIDVQ